MMKKLIKNNCYARNLRAIWVWVLTYGDLKLVSNNRILTDAIINVAQNIIHLQHPSIAELQGTLRGQSLHSKDAKDQQIFCFKELPDQPFVQVLYDDNIHWLAISAIDCLPGEAFIMDSMFRGKINHHVQRQICSIMHCSMDTIKAKVLPLQQQANSIDCGLHALAVIVYLLENNKYQTEVLFDQNEMRNHLLKSFESNQIGGFHISSSKKVKKNKKKEISVELFCSCRMIWVESDNIILRKFFLNGVQLV